MTVAFGLANPWMLLWLPTAALPLVIHLLGRRARADVPWAATRLLQQAIRRHSRQTRFRNWVLLALRTLLILAVIAAVSEPYVDASGAGALDGRIRHWIVMIDVSLSMGRKDGDVSALDRAKNVAKEFVESRAPGDIVSLLAMGARIDLEARAAAAEAGRLTTAIEGVRLTEGRVVISKALQRAGKELRRPFLGSPAENQASILMLTDLAVNDWKDIPSIQAAMESLPAATNVQIVDVGGERRNNAAIESLSGDSGLITAEQSVPINIRVHGHGLMEARRLELFVDGERKLATTVKFDDAGVAAVTAPLRFEKTGQQVLEARLSQDDLPADDSFWRVFDIAEANRILCVEGKATSRDLPGSADFLRLALASVDSAGDQFPRVRLDTLPYGRFDGSRLPDYHVLACCDVAAWTSDVAAQVARYVKAGGSLVLFLGDNVQENSYNNVLMDALDSSKTLAAVRLESPSKQGAYTLDPLGYAHPIVRSFEGSVASSLLTTPVYRYWRISTSQNERTGPALAFSNGDPAILEHSVGDGRLFVVTVPISTSSTDNDTEAPWTLLPAWPSFVPLMHELFRYAGGPASLEPTLVNQPLPLKTDSHMDTTTARVRLPNGEYIRLAAAANSNRNGRLFRDTRQSGIYELIPSGTGSPKSLYAINIDSLESNSDRIADDQLPPGMQLAPTDDIAALSTTHQGATAEQFPWLMGLALAFLLIEGTWSLHAGHARS